MSTPRAAMLQGGCNDVDQELVELARRNRPQRRWWWGIKRWWEPDPAGLAAAIVNDEETQIEEVARTGAWCYLCNRPIVTWSSRWQVTVTARLAIARHRTDHIQGRLDTPAAETQT